MMRVGLFLLTNLAVMFVFGIILSILGVNAHSTLGLLIFAAIFGFGGSFISLLLSKRTALRSVGGEVIKEPRNDQEQWLLDVVRRQSDQLKLKMPAVAIYEADDINAFATGATKNRSLVAVSTGLLSAMTQDEAEAVIGHEMSHVANGDMVTMALLQGVLNTFVIFISRIIASMFAKVIEDRSEALADIAYYVIAMIFETIFGILASMVAMWFSRYREFHADAGSAKLVGSAKMIAALEKLKVSHEPNEEASILAFCINGEKKARFSQLFLSHPPLEKRIEALKNQSIIG